ncbi:MAG TPA: NAD(P)H-hydrate dehydratase [Gemmatimonadaceae bacterium]|nr:NAD(P)H-hydrate dehydratase [Gemmatimonadaceae bacterium]
MQHDVPILTATESAASDAAAIAAGTPSLELMRAAGLAAANEIRRRFGGRLAEGVFVHAGTGNNGGDGWIVAGALASHGIRVRVASIGEPRTDDARAARESALPALAGSTAPGAPSIEPPDPEGVVIDALLGTGARGRPHGLVAEAIVRIRGARAAGAAVVALDVPSGLDATSGDADGAVTADCTIAFGALKRGHLLARDRCGTTVVVDIGTGRADREASVPLLVDREWVALRIPPIGAAAHKGTRGKLAIVGGAPGMVGAALWAARAALRSGIGMVRVWVHPDSVGAAQAAAPEVMAAPWPETDDAAHALGAWADAVLLGPGLGTDHAARDVAARVLHLWRGPVAVDADALNIHAGRPGELGAVLAGRPALVTPHVAEFARLAGTSPSDVEARRFDIGLSLAVTLGATVLLKGVPTVITGETGQRVVSAAGTPVLATAGSGDLLAGVVSTLLAQSVPAFDAAACGAWLHGRAAERANAGRPVRGVTLDDVVLALAHGWRLGTADNPDGDPPEWPVLAELPAVGEHAP